MILESAGRDKSEAESSSSMGSIKEIKKRNNEIFAKTCFRLD